MRHTHYTEDVKFNENIGLAVVLPSTTSHHPSSAKGGLLWISLTPTIDYQSPCLFCQPKYRSTPLGSKKRLGQCPTRGVNVLCRLFVRRAFAVHPYFFVPSPVIVGVTYRAKDAPWKELRQQQSRRHGAGFGEEEGSKYGAVFLRKWLH